MIGRVLDRWFKIRTKEQAWALKRRLAFVYAFIGWNCFGVAFYTIVKRKMPEDAKERRVAYASLTNLTNAPNNTHVYQITGTTITADFDIAYKAKVAEIEKEKKESENVITDEP